MENKEPNPFLITSTGYSATKWVAWALNTHPKVFCEHFFGGSASSDDLSLPELKALYHRTEDYQGGDMMRKLISNLRGKAVAQDKEHSGNVGCFNANELVNICSPQNPRDIIRTVNLIRHPINWVNSGAHHIPRETEVSSSLKGRLLEHMEGSSRIYRAFDVPENPNLLEQGFCYMCNRMDTLVLDAAQAWTSHYKMEKVTKDRDVFTKMFSELTGLDAKGQTGYLDEVFEKGLIHQHQPRGIISPDDQFRQWEPWQQLVYAYHSQRSGIIPAYKKLGYDMDQTEHLTNQRIYEQTTTKRREQSLNR